MFATLDRRVHKRIERRYRQELPGPHWVHHALAGRDGAGLQVLVSSGNAIYLLVCAMGAEALEGRVLSPHLLRHSAVSTAIADLGFSMAGHPSPSPIQECGHYIRLLQSLR